MKKTYLKPQVIFDSFEVSSNVAATCREKADHSRGSCAYNYYGFPVFTDELVGTCQMTAPDGSYGICYYVPIEDGNLFAS